MDTYWNVDGNRELSDTCTGFTRLHMVREAIDKETKTTSKHGKLTTCGNWPPSPQQPLEAPHSALPWDLGQFIAEQLLGNADVIRAMHERVLLCQDPQTEFAFLYESQGVSRINHVLRVHGHTILLEQRAAEIYDEVGQRSLERPFQISQRTA